MGIKPHQLRDRQRQVITATAKHVTQIFYTDCGESNAAARI